MTKKLARVLTDSEWYAAQGASYSWRGDDPTKLGSKLRRGYHLPGYPAVNQGTRTPKGGEDHHQLDDGHMGFVRAVNTQANGQPTNISHPYKIYEIAYCLFNDRGKPNSAEAILFSNMVGNILEIKNGSARLEAIDVNKPAPDVSQVNFKDTPWLVHQVTAIYEEGVDGWNPDYSPVFTKYDIDNPQGKNGLWLPLDRLAIGETQPVLQPGVVITPTPSRPTNQDIINDFYDAWEWPMAWWMLVKAFPLHLPAMIASRGADYFDNGGLYLHAMGLNQAEKEWLRPYLLD